VVHAREVVQELGPREVEGGLEPIRQSRLLDREPVPLGRQEPQLGHER
jgi:hypothetical protein